MNRILAKLYGKNVAIVGNGPVTKDFSYEIDSSDIVIRFNHFYRYDDGLTGKRVDIVCQTIAKAWFDAVNKHVDVIRKYGAEVFLIKQPQHYIQQVHDYYGTDIKVSDYSRFFINHSKFTTGGAFLVWLSQNLDNAKVKVYGFNPGPTWDSYIAGDANHYAHVAAEERVAVDAAISKLEKLEITNPTHITNLRRIVIPVKDISLEAPNKNKILLPRCLKECLKVGLPITVITDSDEIIANNKINNKLIEFFRVPSIAPLADVTDTLRYWRDVTGYFGDIALVQVTSPRLKSSWITNCLERLVVAPVVATAVPIDFKPNALFLQANGGIYIPGMPSLGFQSVPRQKLPKAVRITGAVEAFHSDNLDLDSLWMGGRVEMVEVPKEDALDIDSLEDLEKITNN